MDVTRGVVGIGYQGRELESFVADLTSAGVQTVVDVRLTPISRKKGFSKRALSTALNSAGVDYLHMPSLGNPKLNRAGFGGTPGELADARSRYALQLDEAAAQTAVRAIAALAEAQLVGLLCFEADEMHCHRAVVLSAVHEHLLRLSAATSA